MLQILRYLLFFIISLHLTFVHAELVEEDNALYNELKNMDLDTLSDLKISTIARKAQAPHEVAAAIHIISQEDIRRSGATSIPEVLRQVPGLYVARIDASKWRVSVREDGERFADDLLVMIDGRSVYSPLFAGTFWEQQDVMLQDVERIEILRGPVGTLRGGGAVIGAVNIITESAKKTQGGLAVIGGGTEERGFTSLRYGGKFTDTLHYRVYGKLFERDSLYNPDHSRDDWRAGRTGFRLDWDHTAKDNLALIGDLYSGHSGQQVTVPEVTPPTFSRNIPEDARFSGANILGRWQHKFSQESDLQLQWYFDHNYREEISFTEERDTYDIDFQHRFQLPRQQEILWGFNYRVTTDKLSTDKVISFSPGERTLTNFNGFIQDEIRFFDNTLRLTVGAGVLKNSYTDYLFQPNLRLAWVPNSKHMLWSAITRAYRTPSRLEHDGRIIIGADDNGIRQLFGNPNFRPEEDTSFELGYRRQLYDNISIDLAGFYMIQRLWTSLQELDKQTSIFNNGFHSDVIGAELGGSWQPIAA